MDMKIDSYIKEQFGLPDVDVRTYSPLTLAYIGDGIYDLIITQLQDFSMIIYVVYLIYSNKATLLP